MENFEDNINNSPQIPKDHTTIVHKENEFLSLLHFKHEKLKRRKQREFEFNSKSKTKVLEVREDKKNSDMDSKQENGRYAFPILPPFHPYKLRSKKHPLMILREYCAPYSER